MEKSTPYTEKKKMMQTTEKCGQHRNIRFLGTYVTDYTREHHQLKGENRTKGTTYSDQDTLLYIIIRPN